MRMPPPPSTSELRLPTSRVLVVGLGVSGLWTARFLAAEGAQVTVTEMRPKQQLESNVLGELRDMGVSLETGGHKEETFLDRDLIIVSPGVPQDIRPLEAAIKRGVPVIGELEFASRLIQTPMIAITGTNGKSTVTAFVGQMLKNAGLECFVGGNIGTPLMAYAASGQRADYVVVEVSSFQLDTIETFCPFISVILNISPDHMDRYSNYEAYVRSKLGIFKNQGAGSYLILNDDDKRLSSLRPLSQVSILRYGIKKEKGRHAFLEDGKVQIRLNHMEGESFSLEFFGLVGGHNLENLLGSVLAGLTLGLDPAVIQKTIDGFKGLPNRLERVGELNGVAFYNDSKATNVDAAVKAIESFDQSLVLIAGGRDKGTGYGPLVRASKGRVKAGVFLGEAKGLLAKSFAGIIPYSMVEDMEEAVTRAFSMAQRGDVVLLAPACSSFDMFSDYSHRGMVFRSTVEKLVHG
jgi:UDP-N-acetylmuramoylalanine--D-glutamate ligase